MPIKDAYVEISSTLTDNIRATVIVFDTVFSAPTLSASSLQPAAIFACPDTVFLEVGATVLEEGAVVIASTGKSARPYIRQQPKELQYTRVLAKS